MGFLGFGGSSHDSVQQERAEQRGQRAWEELQETTEEVQEAVQEKLGHAKHKADQQAQSVKGQMGHLRGRAPGAAEQGEQHGRVQAEEGGAQGRNTGRCCSEGIGKPRVQYQAGSHRRVFELVFGTFCRRIPLEDQQHCNTVFAMLCWRSLHAAHPYACFFCTLPHRRSEDQRKLSRKIRLVAFLSFLFFGWESNMSKLAQKHHAQDCKRPGHQVSVLPSSHKTCAILVYLCSL